MFNARFKKILEITIVIVFFSAFVFSLSKPIGDHDVFWHLKTGEWIWQNKSLPDEDPFTFTSKSFQYEASVRTSFILKQYWLAQLIMYGFYQLGGFYGIIVFRCLIYLGIGLLLYYRMRKEGISRISRLVFLLPMVFFSIQWLGERPNNLSFLFAVIVVYLLEDLQQSRRATEQKNNRAEGLLRYWATALLPYCSLPLVMLLWANMHGGFILGDAIIAIYMVAEGFKKACSRQCASGKEACSGQRVAYRKDNTEKHPAPYTLHAISYKLFFAVCLVSILISFVNPNTYKGIYIILGLTSGEYFAIPTTEFLSPFYYAAEGDYKYLIFICIMITPFLLRVKQLKFNSTLLIFFLALLALKSTRYIPFLVFIATPSIAEIWGEYFDKVLKRAEKFYIPVLLIFVVAIFLVSSSIRYTALKGDVVFPFFYPAGAVNFIKTERPECEIFNDLTLGGYLIWSLYPDYKVFIDGRGLFQSMQASYLKAHSGSVEKVNGIPAWKAIFVTHKINAVLVPGSNVVAGGFTRLVRRLVEDNEWGLVFIDKEALLFIKNTEKNEEIIRKYSIPKFVAYGMALRQAEMFRLQFPKEWNAYTTLGEINLYMGRPGNALLYFESAFKLNPSLKSTVLCRLIENVKAGRDYRKLMEEIFR